MKAAGFTTIWRVRWVASYGPPETRQREDFYATYAQASREHQRLESRPEDRRKGSTVRLDSCSVWYERETESETAAAERSAR